MREGNLLQNGIAFLNQTLPDTPPSMEGGGFVYGVQLLRPAFCFNKVRQLSDQGALS